MRTHRSMIGVMAAAALAMGGMAQPAIDTSSDFRSLEREPTPQPVVDQQRHLTRKQRERRDQKARRARDAENRTRKIKLRRPDAYARAVNGMTGWQRNQWARAGYPGSKKREARVVLEFAQQKSLERFRRFVGSIMQMGE